MDMQKDTDQSIGLLISWWCQLQRKQDQLHAIQGRALCYHKYAQEDSKGQQRQDAVYMSETLCGPWNVVFSQAKDRIGLDQAS